MRLKNVSKLNQKKSKKIFKQNHGRAYFKNLNNHNFYGDYVTAIHEDIKYKEEGEEDQIYPASDISYQSWVSNEESIEPIDSIVPTYPDYRGENFREESLISVQIP